MPIPKTFTQDFFVPPKNQFFNQENNAAIINNEENNNSNNIQRSSFSDHSNIESGYNIIPEVINLRQPIFYRVRHIIISKPKSTNSQEDNSNIDTLSILVFTHIKHIEISPIKGFIFNEHISFILNVERKKNTVKETKHVQLNLIKKFINTSFVVLNPHKKLNCYRIYEFKPCRRIIE